MTEPDGAAGTAGPPARAQRVVDAPLTPPSSKTGLLGVFQNRYVLKLLVQREISARYQGSVLGLVWSYVNPLSQFFIYYFVLGTLFNLHKDVPNFAVHMFCGIMIVHFFNETMNAGTRSIVRNKALVRKMALPREMFPVASMLVSAYHLLPQLAIMVVVCVIYGWTPTVGAVAAFLLGTLIIMMLGTAMALLFSAANVFFRDVSNLVGILTNLVRFTVPMIYPYSLVPERFGTFSTYYLYNPLADAVLLFQRAFWVGTTDDPNYIIKHQLPTHLWGWSFIGLGVACLLLVLGQIVFGRLQEKIPERLQ